MNNSFLHGALGRSGTPVFRLGLSGSYWPGEDALRMGIERGMNYLFWYFWDRQMTRVLHDVLKAGREKYVVATGAANFGPWLVGRALESCRKRLRTDYIDVFQIFWVGDGRLSERTLDVLRQAKEQGKIRNIAISTHARKYAGQLVRDGKLDVIMMRYNAAHRGAEEEIFPELPASQPGVVSYTATRWGRLLRRPRRWPESERIATPGDCYRFVLTNPNVHVCLTAPRNRQQLEENLKALDQGPLCGEEMQFMRRFGDAVHAEARYFM